MTSTQTLPALGDIPRVDRRAARFSALRYLWDNSTLAPVRSCFHHSVTGGDIVVKVQATADGFRAGLSGAPTCGSVWVCPVCSHKIATQRAQELATAIRKWQALDGTVVMVTMTMRHNKGQKLADLWGGVSHGWKRATSGRAWVQDQALNGSDVNGKTKIPWVRTTEITHGVNGWHVHVHALLFLRGEFSAQGIGSSMFQRWRKGLMDKGFSAPIATSGGLDIRAIESDGEVIAGYLNKSTYDGALGASFEATFGAHKEANGKGRTPFQILAALATSDTPDRRDLALWYEYEAASHGRRQMGWSLGFRALLALEPEVSDEALAAADMDNGHSVEFRRFDKSEWKHARWNIAAILSDAETWAHKNAVAIRAEIAAYDASERAQLAALSAALSASLL